MKKCLVIGGGFAGLSASVHLSNSGYKIGMIEASPKLGGRAYSFSHKQTNMLIDNGQHIMMGCYNETLKFLELIGASNKLEIQEELSVKFLKPGFERHQLKASSLLYPFNLLSAIYNYSAISLLERLAVLRFFLKLPFFSHRDLSKMSVDDLLIKENQNENVKKAFWEILCVGALNTNLQKASAKVFIDILKEIFLKGSLGSKIILPKTSLSEMYCEPAKQFIEEKGGNICLAERVEEIVVEKNKAVEVRTDRRSITDFDFVICAVPHYALERIVRSSSHASHFELVSESEHEYKDKIKLLKQSPYDGQHDYFHSIIQSFNPQYSSILNVHVWLKEKRFGKNFYALIGSKLHWVFSHDSHITCVISEADYLLSLSDEGILHLITAELEKYINITKHDIKDYFIIREKRATFIPSDEILNNRPNTKTEIKNLFLAGDWVNTCLPSTIESAVKSGRIAAEVIVTIKDLNRLRSE